MLIVLTLLVLIMIVLVFVPFNLKKHDVSYYVITQVLCEKNNTIYALSDLRFCKAHNCFETQDILDQNKWESVILNDSALSIVKYKNLYFRNKEVLKEFKKLKKKFKIDCNEIKIKFYN